MPLPSAEVFEEPAEVDAVDALSSILERQEPARVSLLAACFANAQPVLHAMVNALDEGDSLVVAANRKGFPLAQRVLRKPRDLPRAIVIGRHNRCALPVLGDSRVSLRHVLLTGHLHDGGTRFRGYDLGGRAGLVLATGKRVAGFSFEGHGLVNIGRTILFAVEGGPRGAELLAGDAAAAFQRLTGIDPEEDEPVSHTIHAMMEPGVAHLGGDESASFGYRGVDGEARAQKRGKLRLRSVKDGSRGEVKELDVDSLQLQRGLLIGRYSDRCSLAGHGRNLSRVHALVSEESPTSLLVYDLASTNGVRPAGMADGPSHAVVRLTEDAPALLGHFELSWIRGE